MGIFDRIVGQLGELIDQIDEPDDVRLRVERGEELLDAGDLDGAARELGRALQLKPDHTRAGLLLGRVELLRGEPEAAERALREALGARADFPEAQVLLGEALVARGDERGAMDALRRALDGGLSDPELRGAAWRSLGALHLSAGRADKAVRELRKAVASLSNDAEANRLLGEALAARGDLDGARTCLERAAAALAPTVERPARPEGAAPPATTTPPQAVTTPGQAPSPGAAAPPPPGAAPSQGAAAAPQSATAPTPGAAAPPPPGTAPGQGAATPAQSAAAPSPGAAAPPASVLRARPATAARLAQILVRLGDVERRRGRIAEARAALERAISLAPGSVDALLALADLEAAAGNPAAALNRSREAVAIERSPRALLAVARHLDGPPLDVQAAYEEARSTGRSRAERAAIAREAMRHALFAIGRSSGAEAALAAVAARAANLVLLDSVEPAGGDGAVQSRVPDVAAGGGGAVQSRIPDAATGSGGGAARQPGPRSTETAEILAANALGALFGSPSTPPDIERAARLAGEAIAAGASLEALLVHARVAVVRGSLTDAGEAGVAAARAAAAASLRRALELSPPGDPRARDALGELHRTAPLPGGELDLYALLRAAHARLLAAPEISDLAPDAARVVEILDRPLLVTVMGEFNAGKSTFVNALVGEEVAPMGIVPTTATINVLKYGAERGGRVVYRDDTVRTVPWADVGPLLRALDESEAKRIRYVEVLYPLETLQRVNIVDTPGLNSIRPEHEATAREFIAQADAIIWLFSCRQPGTASEREALGKVHEAHKKALGVVNQIDRLESPAQVEEVLAFLREHFADLVEALVPFSAREALLGRADPERLARSNRALLDRTLDERFFDRAKAIQRAQAVRRLEALLDEASRRGEVALASARRDTISAARTQLESARLRFGRFLVEERLALIGDLDAVYGQAAREVLDFARPRSWAFGANQAAPADRDFLIDLVVERLGGLADGSRRRVAEEVERAAAQVLGDALPRQSGPLVHDELRLLDEQVYGRYRAFIRGFLRGGRVDDFFTRVLPRLELGEQAIRRALLRDLPALDVLEEELEGPLARFAERFLLRLHAELEREAGEEELRRLEVAARLVDPVAELRAALARFATAPDERMVG